MRTDDQEENRQGTELRHGQGNTHEMPWLRRARLLGCIVGTLAILLACGTPVRPARTSPPSSSREPTDIVAGPDGNLWFGEIGGQGGIGRMTPSGILTEFKPTSFGWQRAIVVGPDGNIWFGSDIWGGTIGRIIPGEASGDLTAPLLYHTAGRPPRALAVGPDGALWFADVAFADIGRVTTAGEVSTFPLPDYELRHRSPIDIVAGPDGNLWFTEGPASVEVSESFIGRITPRGGVTEFKIPTARAGFGSIVAGPDGNLWFTEPQTGRIGRISVDGRIVEFALPTDPADPAWIDRPAALAAGRDGALWLGVWGKRENALVQVTITGQVISRLPLDASIQPFALTMGPDGNLWFTDTHAGTIGQIGRVTPAGMVTTFDLPIVWHSADTPSA